MTSGFYTIIYCLLNSRDDTWQHRENNEVDMLNGLLGALPISDNQA